MAKQRDNTYKNFHRDRVAGEITEYYIINILKKLGFTAIKMVGNVRHRDIIATDPKGKEVKIEVKTDFRTKGILAVEGEEGTGNFYIEFKYRGDDSGIMTSDANYWFISDTYNIYIIDKDDLKKLCKTNNYKISTMGGYKNGTKGYLIPEEDIKEIAYSINKIPEHSEAWHNTIVQIKLGVYRNLKELLNVDMYKDLDLTGYEFEE